MNTYCARWFHNGSFYTTGTFHAHSADEVRAIITANRGTDITITVETGDDD